MQKEFDAIFYDLGGTLRLVQRDEAFEARARRRILLRGVVHKIECRNYQQHPDDCVFLIHRYKKKKDKLITVRIAFVNFVLRK